ncbi:DUF6969 family protein [Noviherbaspirillum galbum]|uniref:DUF6969 family protein n=1 Tax=Noviherbaspirillum galbum TaxID=2709383 RepID=UPI002E29A25A|nr:hypothetical protein [Noviherbaspirillum galbum]
MRTQKLGSVKKRRPCPETAAAAPAAAFRLLETYANLAKKGEHLLGNLLDGTPPRQWAHYPEADAIDQSGGYQWFYHSHSPADREVTSEHGHIHLFARKPLWGRRLRLGSEGAFAMLCGNPQENPETRHLVGLGFDAKGIPISLFTVNSWVTGDLMLGADLTLELLQSINLNTGHADIDTVIESVVRLCAPELQELLRRRDEVLRRHQGPDKLFDQSLELLSEVHIDLDKKLATVAIM